jgi:hypothetical protein
MSNINLLLSIYFEEKNDEGLDVLKMLLSDADDSLVTVFGSGKRYQLRAKDLGATAEHFNLVQGKVMRPDGEIRFRYRPATSSSVWSKPGFPDPVAVTSEDEHEIFQLFLTLTKFSNTGLSAEIRDSAVFELLIPTVVSVTMEHTISECLIGFCLEILATRAWGYADAVPFRGLSVEEEWSAAKSDVLWLDLSVTGDSEHQYMFTSPGAKPKVPVPTVGVREKELVVYRLLPPRWRK